MRKWNLIPYILKPSLAVFCNLFPHQVILNPPRSLVKEPYDLSQNSPFLLWKKLLVQISMSSHISEKKDDSGIERKNGTKYKKYKIHKKKSPSQCQSLNGRMECHPPENLYKKQKPLSLSIWTNYPGSERKNGMPASCTWSRKVWWAHAYT